MEGKNVTRRALLATAGTLGVGALAAGALGACSSNNATGSSTSTEKTADIIIVGSGLSGIVAGIKALDSGKSVAIVEKAMRGGNSIIAGGSFSAPLTESAADVDAFYEDYMSKALQRTDPDLIRLLADRSWEAMNWLTDLGCEFLEPYQYVPYRVLVINGAPAVMQGMGVIMPRLFEEFENKGGVFIEETKMLGLIRDDATSGFIGIRATDGNSIFNIIGGCVILAAGGYAANKEMLARYLSIRSTDDMPDRGSSVITGDGLIAAQKEGAALIGMPGVEGVQIVAVAPENIAGGNPAATLPYSIAVNSEGKRFIDESLGYALHGKAVAKQTVPHDSVIYDSNLLETVPHFKNTQTQFEGLGIPIRQANTLEELAEIIDVPADALVATVAEFNAAVQDDHTTTGLEFNKAANAYKIEKAPFYVYTPLSPATTLTFGGVKADKTMRVLESDGTVMKGLYAVGEMLGGFFVSDYIQGGSLSRCVVTGFAGAEAAVAYLG